MSDRATGCTGDQAPDEPSDRGTAPGHRTVPDFDAVHGYDAVILAGGRARRMGGADKPGARVGDRTLLGLVADAVAAAGRLVVVGPPRPEPPRALVVREDPPGGGPVPALRAGLAEVRAPWTVLLAADLPFLRAAHIAALIDAARGHGAGALLIDASGHEQWLAGAWSTGRLRRALHGYQGASLKGLLGPLDPAGVRPGSGGLPPWYDCDTADDLDLARELLDPAAPGSRADLRS